MTSTAAHPACATCASYLCDCPDAHWSRPRYRHEIGHDERQAIRERRRYQPAAELAAAFNTTPRVIGNICREW